MHYYLVRVASSVYRRDEPLTYMSKDKLDINTLVAVPVQRKTVVGLIVAPTDKPAFETREVLNPISKQPLPSAFIGLIEWLRTYYPSTYGNILLASLPSSLLVKPRSQTNPYATKTHTPAALPPLTKEQEKAIKIIRSKDSKSILLHGETGSGKTRLYLEYAKDVINSGKSALIMTPEIGLTPQLAKVFEETFGPESIVTFHSMLTVSERHGAWLKILHAENPLVIVGPRSSMFTPIKQLGLIVMDEAHEAAYKQEQAPYYQTSRVAAKLANLHGAKFIMGTATPLVADYYAYKQKGLPIVRLSSMAIKGGKLPNIQTVSLGDRDKFKRSVYLSDPMITSIETALESNEQSLVYLNRRGSARVVLCQKCGWQAICPNCDSPMVYHGDDHKMRCHICGYTKPAPPDCPSCGNPDITFRSIGTKMVVDELKRIFPGAKVQRFDKDNIKSERLENLYESVKEGKTDILVGTQILGKGLDLPRLSVVGVAQADTSLQIPDYTADEVTYQQLVQIIGRVGRGHLSGTAVIQSHNVDGPALRAAIRRDYELFYESQLKLRKLFGFPPFYFLLKLSCHRASSKNAEKAAEKFAEQLRAEDLRIEVIGPSPAFHAKKANQYYWQLIVKSKQRDQLLTVIDKLPSGWSYDIDPVNLL